MKKQENLRETYISVFGQEPSFEDTSTDSVMDTIVEVAKKDGTYRKLGYETIFGSLARELKIPLVNLSDRISDKIHNVRETGNEYKEKYKAQIKDYYVKSLIRYRTIMRNGVPFEKYDVVQWIDPKSKEVLTGIVNSIFPTFLLVSTSLIIGAEGYVDKVPLTLGIKIVKKATAKEREEIERKKKEKIEVDNKKRATKSKVTEIPRLAVCK